MKNQLSSKLLKSIVGIAIRRRALLSMTYFEDADPQPMPFMFQSVGWNEIKDEIKHQVETYNRRYL